MSGKGVDGGLFSDLRSPAAAQGTSALRIRCGPTVSHSDAARLIFERIPARMLHHLHRPTPLLRS